MRNDAIAAMIGERAVLYLRVSSDQQEANTSFESQEREGRRWCAEQGMEVVAVFRDTHTGAELWERKGLQAARECLRRRDAGVLVALAIDRLTRDSVHLGILIEEAERVGARIAFVQEPLDTSPEGMLLQHVRGYAAAVEREKFRGRTMLAKRTRVARHQLLPSNRELFGYRWADETKGRYVVDPERAPIVERLFRERAGGASFRQLAAALNADHITTSAGKPWGPSSVQYTLSHPAYKGEAFAFRSKNTRERSEADPSRKVTRCVLRPSDEWVKLPDGTIPALVPADLWQAAQEASTRGPARGSRPPIDPEVVLLRGGYARCGYCGGSMTANRPGGKRKVANIRYQCSERSRVHKKCPGGGHSINAAIIDAAALDRIEAILTKPEVMRAALLRYLGDDPTGADLEAIDRREAQIERKIGNLVGSLEDLTGAAGDAVRARLADLEQQIAALDGERAEIKARRAGWERARATLDRLEVWYRAFGAEVGQMTYQDKRDALEGFGIRATVWGRDHAPRYVIEANVPLSETDQWPLCQSAAHQVLERRPSG